MRLGTVVDLASRWRHMAYRTSDSEEHQDGKDPRWLPPGVQIGQP